MTPENIEFINDFTIREKPSLTYAIKTDEDRVRGKVTDREAIEQAIYKILSTERYDYIIYSHKYGVELRDLMGEQSSYVKMVLPSRITEALLMDDRITSVEDFEITTGKKGVVTATFTVGTTLGNYTVTKEVSVNV